jgi:hypothetical protein
MRFNFMFNHTSALVWRDSCRRFDIPSRKTLSMHLRPVSGTRPVRALLPRTLAGALLAAGLGLAAACGAQDLDRLLTSNDAGLQSQWAVRF